ncbi:MAG: ribonuclease domain-containing protein [Micropruina sp.]|uniref:ribonuclease domain-containing protein n=1 Tax=Micropruina sp. TaxID=2737536 RepID=UPI0039E2B737
MNGLTGRTRLLVLAGLVLVVLLGVVRWWQAGRGEPAVAPVPSVSATGTAGTRSVTPSRAPTRTPPTTASPAAGSSTTASSTVRGRSGLPVCTRVPAEVSDAVAAVRNNGPYLRPRDDGGSFGNRERLLPPQPQGYYREYTVRAPGQRFPGPRRLVTGGQARLGAEPAEWFYTADHYESFCELRP